MNVGTFGAQYQTGYQNDAIENCVGQADVLHSQLVRYLQRNNRKHHDDSHDKMENEQECHEEAKADDVPLVITVSGYPCSASPHD